jgi:hypothetical protein
MIINKQTNQELGKVGDTYQYDFGARKLNSRVAVTLQVKGEIYKSSHMVHNINREIFVNYAENGENKSEKIKITGQIIK